MRKTKIICTLGPSTDCEATLAEMIRSGMDVARFNFSHQDHDCHRARLKMLREVRERMGAPIASLLDTRGPEIRLCRFENGSTELISGNRFTLTARNVIGTDEIASITYKNLHHDVQLGTRILIDDGLIELKVIDLQDEDIECVVVNGGPVSNNKGINVPGVNLSMPYLSEQDVSDILFGIENEFDFVAASFTRSAQDVLEIRKLLDKNGGYGIRIIAKIENGDGVNNIDEIIQVSDGIMIARGDMGVEIPLEEIPVIQKMIIKKAYNAGKQVITATQMLDSMMKNPRPTRAEITDVANAIYDGTSAIMLSGETAAGKHPIESVKVMALIAERAEKDINYQQRFFTRDVQEVPNVTNAISHATCTTAYDLGASAIITVTKTGQTARMISKYRPSTPIVGCTFIPQVWRQMNLSWGVKPVMVEEKDNTDDLFDHSVEMATKAGVVRSGDLVVITAGVPLGISGTTNLLKVHIVGDVLVSGKGVNTASVCGALCVCRTEDEAIKNFKSKDILAIPYASSKMLPILKQASAIITEEDNPDSYAAIVGLTLDIPVIIAATNATSILKSGTVVSVDAKRGIVCNVADSGKSN